MIFFLTAYSITYIRYFFNLGQSCADLHFTNQYLQVKIDDIDTYWGGFHGYNYGCDWN